MSNDSRTKNATRNLVFGTITRIYNLIVPFIMRTVVIYWLGMEYEGLGGVFSSVLSVLNLAELGVGSAMTFSMYKPIAQQDTMRICALMRLYKLYYRAVGAIILVIGLAIMPALPLLIKKDLPPDINLYALYLINLTTTVVSYWLFAYKNCLLFAHQRNDIGDKIGYIINTLKYGVQIAVLYFTRNYYLYVMLALLGGIVGNIVTAIVVDKLYPQYKAFGKLPKEEVQIINKRIKDLFTSKIGSVVYDSADTLVISAFLGLTALAKYQNYFYILSAVFGFVTLITSSSLAGIGNSLVTESEEKNYCDLRKFTFLLSWLSAFCICCFACLYQPFMTLWVGKDNLLPYGMVLILCAYFIIRQINNLLNLYKDAAGMWHEDRWRPLICSLVNLVVNLIMVQFWGLYGILLSTIIAMLVVGMPWLTHNLFTVVFHCSWKPYVGRTLRYVALAAICCGACVGICHFITLSSLIVTMILRFLVCALLPNAVFFIAYRKTDEFVYFAGLLNRLTKGKVPVLRRWSGC